LAKNFICLYRGGRIRPDLRNPFDPSGSKPDPNLIRSIFLRKSNWSDPIRTRPDPIRDQMAFNPIEIYQRSEKTQHINWPDPDPISSKKSNWPDPSDPNPNLTRPVRLPPLWLYKYIYRLCDILSFWDKFCDIISVSVSVQIQARKPSCAKIFTNFQTAKVN
jgi:hypothetical protein